MFILTHVKKTLKPENKADSQERVRALKTVGAALHHYKLAVVGAIVAPPTPPVDHAPQNLVEHDA
jgi:hypothetical protein